MATFLVNLTRTSGIDLDNFYLLTAGGSQTSSTIPNQFSTTGANTHGFLIGYATGLINIPPNFLFGTVSGIYLQAMDAGANPGSAELVFSGLSVEATVALDFMTTSSQIDSLNFLNTIYAGADTMTGSGYDDTLQGFGGGDTLNGGAGTDTLSYSTSNAGVRVNIASGLGLGGHATGDHFSGFENLTGSAYGDILVGDGGDNVLAGGAGDDRLSGGAGYDGLLGGDGDDTADYHSSPVGITASLGQNIFLGGDAEGDTLVSIENLTGSDHDDYIQGNAGSNRLTGLSGDDTLQGQSGDDTLLGGDGIDTLDGEGGDDTLIGGAHDDTLTGGTGNDTLKGDTGNDTMSGGFGNDTYSIDSLLDIVTEQDSEGTDRIITTINDYTLTAHVENLTLNTGVSAGTGNALNNTIRGNAINNWLSGLDGVDTLQGLDGDDALVGGGGNDRLYGGAGADTFVYNDLSDGGDRIADWDSDDHLAIDAAGFGLALGDAINIINGLSAHGLAGDTFFYKTSLGQLYFHDGDTGKLTFVTALATKPASLDAADFILV